MNEGAVKKLKRFLLALVFWLGLWFALSVLIRQELLLPSPWQVLRRLLALAGTRSFWRMTGSSILRVLIGIVSAALLGVLLAFLTHCSRLAHTLLAPLMTLVKSTPVASFIVLALVWIGRDLVPVFITGLIVLPVVWGNMSEALVSMDPKFLELAKVYRMPRLRILRRITLPSVLPSFRAALSTSLGLGWKAGIAAEVLTVPKQSVGRMIYESKLYLETTDLFAWTVTVVVLSLIIERTLFMLIGRSERGRQHA
ncbi:MAG: ABC transporter permease subunit [Oscillospiraceae bacterium]|nr:ABC transporter permease subunit [Oscillospiraceae bacterium]